MPCTRRNAMDLSERQREVVDLDDVVERRDCRMGRRRVGYGRRRGWDRSSVEPSTSSKLPRAIKTLHRDRDEMLQKTSAQMAGFALRATYSGGPSKLAVNTVLRSLTDPTFDPAGTEYRTPVYTILNTCAPAISVSNVVLLEAVLLLHDHRIGKLDHA